MVGKKRQDPPVEVEEGDFPRGGREDLTPLEKRQLSQQAEADFKQEAAANQSGKNQRKRIKHSKDKVRRCARPNRHSSAHSSRPQSLPRAIPEATNGAMSAACCGHVACMMTLMVADRSLGHHISQRDQPLSPGSACCCSSMLRVQLARNHQNSQHFSYLHVS